MDAHDREYRAAIDGMAETYGQPPEVEHAIGDSVNFTPDGEPGSVTLRGTVSGISNEGIYLIETETRAYLVKPEAVKPW